MVGRGRSCGDQKLELAVVRCRFDQTADGAPGRDGLQYRVQRPMRWASSSRWYEGSPNNSSEDLARLKYR